MPLTTNDVRYKIADSPVIFSRGEALFALGAYERQEINPQQGIFRYLLKGSQTSYQVQVVWREGMPAPRLRATAPTPGGAASTWSRPAWTSAGSSTNSP